MTFRKSAMHPRFMFFSGILAVFFLAAAVVPSFAEDPPTQKPAVRKDRIFIKDIEGIWINEAYLSVLAALKSPHAAAKKTPPVVIAIRRDGRAYPASSCASCARLRLTTNR